jgi:hypothetical protein
MLIEDFFPEFKIGVKKGDTKVANNAIMKQVGNYIVNKRQDFVDLLKESGIEADINDSDSKLVNLFVTNIGKNRELAMGTSLLMHWDNREYGVDGSDNKQSIQAGYHAICNFFGNEEISNFIPPAAVAGAITEVSKVGSQLLEGSQKKKYGVTDAIQKQQEAKTAIAQQVLAQRQIQLEQAAKAKEAEAKTTKIIVISVSAVVVIGIVGLLIYKFKSKK